MSLIHEVFDTFLLGTNVSCYYLKIQEPSIAIIERLLGSSTDKSMKDAMLLNPRKLPLSQGQWCRWVQGESFK